METILTTRAWLRQQNQPKINLLLERAGVPERFWNAPRNLTFVQRAIGNVLDEYCQRPRPPGLLFHGPAGSGKTVSAAVYCRELLLMGIHCIWWDVATLADHFRYQVAVVRNPGEVDSTIEHLCGVGHLFLDDLGAGKNSEWVYDRIYQTLNRRYEKGAPVTATVNDLSCLDDRLARRLVEDAVEVRTSL